ncbi:MAG: formate dehydrogenase accessory protein FdhE [Acidobacteria bacterium]|nr:formate dehydrogenase accessory protein FdhE [Acidobacteriota bacterium]
MAALRELVAEHPDLAPAAELQIELAQITRRLSARAPLPFLAPAPERQSAVASGTRVLSYKDFRFDWSAVRLAVREVARALESVGALPREDSASVERLVRGETPALERCLSVWFDARLDTSAAASDGPASDDGLHEVLDTAMRPFLMRAASAALTGLDLAAWNKPCCPACGAEPDFAVITRDGKRNLCCHRCRTLWAWHAWACPRCENDDRSTISSFASRDGLYRIYACGKCMRYVKAFDGRNAPRPFLPDVDLIATLPLDAAAIQKGFNS